MKNDLDTVANDIYLLLSDKDILFPPTWSVINAYRHLQNLKEFKEFENVGG